MPRPRTSSPSRSKSTADVLIVGDGVIGLATAIAIARAGGSCRILGRTTPGAASAASAGLLAPSIGDAEPGFRAFMSESRDRYPSWLYWLAQRTGIEVPLDRSGIIALEPQESTRPRERTERLDVTALKKLEPALASQSGAVLYHDDGYVDNVRLLVALREAARCEWSIDVVEGRVAAIQAGVDSCTATMEDGRSQRGRAVVLAGGAWIPLLVGTPRPLPVEPVRGQMLRLQGSPLSHAVSADDAYLVPRGESTLVGSTLERVGFDSATTPAALDRLRLAAVAAVPSLRDAPVESAWAGLRPMTPDARPIIGQDPDLPTVIYACGHGKNGILLAPITAECVSSLVAGGRPPLDISSFDIQRFG
jgi:glycine/D-amino acid oxidase-like deaminating enzyme